MTQDEWGYVVIAIVAVALLWVVFRPIKDDGEPKPTKPKPPRPSLPPFCAAPSEYEPRESLPLIYPVPGQQADTEWLPMSPDARAAIVDSLRALYDASPDEDVRTDLRADPSPPEAA